MACCLTPHRGTEKSQRQLMATCLNKGIAIQFLTLPHLPPPSFKGAPRFIECRRLILWHKQSTRCEVSSFISCFTVHLTHSVWSLYNATAMLVPVGDPPKLFSRRIPSSNIRHEKLLGKFWEKKEKRHEKGKIVHLSIHFLSFVNDLIFKNLEGYFKRQKKDQKKRETGRSHWGDQLKGLAGQAEKEANGSRGWWCGYAQ